MAPGGVITGRVIDEYGEPVSDVFVSAQRQQFVNGTRRPMQAGSPSSSNDIGEFRIYGLAPGEYYIAASLRGGSGNPYETTADRSGYAPTYYPSTPDIAGAQRVTVRAGDTVSNLVVSLVATRTARVSGIVVDGQGQPAKGGVVTAMLAGSVGMPMPMTPGMVRPDGTFTINNVAPGQYVLRSVPMGGTGPGGLASMALASITVNGADLSNVVLQPQAPIKLTGRLTGDAPTLAQIKPASTRLMVAPSGPVMAFGPTGPPQPVHDDLSFDFTVYPGDYIIRPLSLPNMVVRAVRLDGRDVSKGFHVDVGATLNEFEVEVTASTAHLIATAENARGEAVGSRDVVVFSQDETQWGVQMPGHSSTGRTDDQGRYQTPPLLPGAYYVALPDGMESGQASDPEFLESLRTKAQRVTLVDGGTATVQLRVSDR